ncbi:MAG: hypothetical protein WDW38_003377 [Sanguina aurantia]
MNYKFSNLLGAPYRGGSLLIHDNELLTPVGNRISQISLTQSTSHTLPFENLKQVRTLALSPDGALLLSIDDAGRALLINRKRRALLHHFSFKGPVSVAKFSPDGAYVAVGVGRLVQVWRAPGFEKQMSPMQLHRTFGQCHSDVLDLDWTDDSCFIAVASKDITVRVFSLDPIEGYEPPTLSGHKDGIVGVFFSGPATRRAAVVDGKEPAVMYSLSRDGALHAWAYAPGVSSTREYAHHVAKRMKRQQGGSSATAEDGEEGAGDEGQAGEAAAGSSAGPKSTEEECPRLAGGKWLLSEKHYFNQRGANVSSYAYHKATGILAVGFTNGVFDLYQLPDFQNLHTLSLSQERVTALTFNATGDWIAVGVAKLGQLLVWEWRSESYVLKQQGHYFDISAVAFSPDGSLIATGADDNKVKIFQQTSGFCFVTFSEHTAPVTAVAFLPSGHALLSASLDGTVRAFDLVRYRNFRTMTSPTPVQFGSLAVDPSGEIVVAGTVDTFQIYVWSLKTGRLLDILSGHEGPVSALAFSPTGPLLASASWDCTVRTWDVFEGKGAVEALQHGHDVLALAFRPDGKQLVASTLDGSIYFWDPQEAELQGMIEGRRDIKGGRLLSDRRSAGNTGSGASFTSLAFTADGASIIAGGSSKYVCIYDEAERIMLRRFQVTHNRSLDGVLDTLNSKNMTDAGPLELIDHEEKNDDLELLPVSLDAAAAADMPGTSNRKRPIARTRAVALSPTGRVWAAATTEGLLLYSLDDELVFDPTDLTEELTPEACTRALASRAYVRALLIALRLGDGKLLRHCVFSTPVAQVPTVGAALPAAFVPQVLTLLSEYLSDSPHLEFLLVWMKGVCSSHGPSLEAAGRSGAAMPALRSLQKALNRLHGDLEGACEDNIYTLDYLIVAGVESASK